MRWEFAHEQVYLASHYDIRAWLRHIQKVNEVRTHFRVDMKSPIATLGHSRLSFDAQFPIPDTHDPSSCYWCVNVVPSFR